MSEFSNQETEKLKQLRKKGFGYTKIADELNKTSAEIKNKCIQLEYPATNGEELSKKLKGQYKFSAADKYKAQNQVLLGILWVKDIPISELADRIDRSSRTVQRYVYEAILPPRNVQRRIASILEIPREILFWREMSN